MKITASKINDFLKKPLSFTSCLIYGENSGKVKDSLQKIIPNSGFDIDDPFSSTILSFKDIVSDHSILSDKVNTLSFNGNMRLLHITDVDQVLPPNLQKIFDSVDHTSTYIILTSQKSLPIGSSTRIYFEGSKQCAVIPCYNDEQQGIKYLIKNFLKKNQVLCKDNVIDTLCHYLAGDRANIYSELEKLITYVGNQQFINEENILSCFTNDFQATLEDICFAFADKNTKKFLSLADKEKNVLLTVKALAKYFMRLYQVLIQIKQENEVQLAINSLKPPVFFKHLKYFKRHLTLWNMNEITKLLNQFLTIEIACKRGYVASKIMLQSIAL